MGPTTSIRILQVDGRAGYRRDEYYPKLIFIGTVLRWSVMGNISQNFHLADQIVERNNFSLDSTADFLADHIESGGVSIFSVYSRLPLGRGEKEAVVKKLRGLDGGMVGGLVEDRGYNYYVDGHQLFQAVMASAIPIDDDFEKGGVWHRLAWDAPKEWHDDFGFIEASSDEKNDSQANINSARRKKNALIKELGDIWPSIARDFQDSSRNGLSKMARLPEHGYWDINRAVTWAVQEGKIEKKSAAQSVTTKPDSAFTEVLKQLLGL